MDVVRSDRAIRGMDAFKSKFDRKGRVRSENESFRLGVKEFCKKEKLKSLYRPMEASHDD